MSQIEKQQKVKVKILKDFSWDLLKRQIVLEEGDTKTFNMDAHNQALIQLLAMAGGNTVYGYITPTGQLAVDGGAFGYDDFIMVNFHFIDVKSIEASNCNFHRGKLYRMEDRDDIVGSFVGMDFDEKTKSFTYSIVTSTRDVITGTEMIELSDEDLDIFGIGDRFAYYTEGNN